MFFSAATIFCITLTGPDPADRVKLAPRLELFAKEGWYKEQEGKEQEFVGILRNADKKGGVGFGRFNPYRLEMMRDEVREVYVGGKPALLAPYVGTQVKITGKAVDMEVEGRRHREIWPARLEVVADLRGLDKKDDMKISILARDPWPHGSTNPDKREKAAQFVFRSGEDLIKVSPYNLLDALPAFVAKMAGAEMAKILKVETINWKDQMLIVVTGGTQSSGGFRIGVTKLTVVGDKLVVEWFLQPPRGFSTDAFTHPAEVILVPRFDGPVEFRQVPLEEKKRDP